MSETDPFNTFESFNDIPAWRMTHVALAAGYFLMRFGNLATANPHEPSKVERALAIASRNEAVIYEHSRTVPDRTRHSD